MSCPRCGRQFYRVEGRKLVCACGYIEAAKQRGLFRMKCKQCEREYQYEGTEYEWEICPMCGHQAPFKEFCQ